MKDKFLNHLKTSDPILHKIALELEIDDFFVFKESEDLFVELCKIIVNQQLSGKAADTIFGRFKKLFPKEQITSEQVLKLTDKKLRNVGMSWSKASFIKDLAQKVVTGEVELEKFKEMENEKIMREIVMVKGIGPWSAEMFLMFSLGRPDVFSAGDLGLMRAIQKIYNFKKEPTKNELEKISAVWSPYRTYASRILWRSLDSK